MSNSEFVKGACAHCAGHLEFPATATGQSVPCPHCGQPTVLAATNEANKTGQNLKSHSSQDDRTPSSEPRSSRREEAQTSSQAFQTEPPDVGCYGSGVQSANTSEKSHPVPLLSMKGGLAAGLAVCLVATGLGGAFYWTHKATPGGTPEAKTVSPGQSNTPAVVAVAPAPPPEPKPKAETNDFAIMPFKLENTPGSSLVYVTGTVRNLSDQQRFGVKLTFSLYDANDNPVGSATDYESVLAPHADWRFKALVMESKTVSARFSSIVEDK